MEPPMTVKELSEYLRLDRMTIYKMLKEGSIPASRIGHQWRFFRGDIDEWIRSRRIGQQASVLVLDGDPATRKLFEAELEPEHVEVVVAASSEEAATLVSQRRFDMVFMDLKRQSVDAFRKIRSIDDSVPVVVLASSSDGKLIDQAMEVGAFTLMKKPSSGSDFKSILSILPLKKNAADN